MDSKKTDETERTGAAESPKAAASIDPTLLLEDLLTEEESRAALHEFPWGSVFPTYRPTEFKGSSSESKWMKSFDVESSESSSEGGSRLPVYEWMNDPDFVKQLCETGPSTPVVSSPEGAEEKKPLDLKSVEAAVSNLPFLLMGQKIHGFDVENYPDFDPYEGAAMINDWDDDDMMDPPVMSLDHVLEGAGLVNLHSTCFMNSVLQCMVHTVPLFVGIISKTDSLQCFCPNGMFCLRCRLEELFRSVTSGIQYYRPKALARDLSYFSATFKLGQQDDAHDFLLRLWNRLMECDKNYDDNAAAHNDTFVRRVFGGRVVNKVTCCACGNVSQKPDDVFDLQLPVDEPDSLIMALEAYMKATVPDYRCEMCGKTGAIQKIELDQVPPIATFHLKRFDSMSNKIKKHVSFPLLLDLLPFASKNDVDLKYELYAIVVHEGDTAKAGHYYSFIRLTPNVWCKFNDSEVLVVKEGEVFKEMAYILFYAKQGTAWFRDVILAQQSSQGFTSLAASQPSSSEPVRGVEIALTHGEEGSRSEGDRDYIRQETTISLFPEFTGLHQDVSLGGGKEAGEGATKVDEADEDASLIGEKKVAGEDASLTCEKKAADGDASLICEKKAVDDYASLIDEEKAADEDASLIDEEKAADEDASLIAEEKAVDEDASLIAEKKAVDEDASLIAEKKAADEDASLVTEEKAVDEDASLIAGKKAVDEDASLIAEEKASDEGPSLVAEKKAKVQKRRHQKRKHKTRKWT